jgi:hypothetical protein
MTRGRYFVDYRLNHFFSTFLIFCVFILILTVAILAVLYSSAILNTGNSVVEPFSISGAECNSSGLFISLHNNLNSLVTVSSAQLVGINRTVLFSIRGPSQNIAAGGDAVLYSSSYLCPSFNSLPFVRLDIAFGSATTTIYTFGNNYWEYLLAGVGNVSESAH